MKHIAAVCALVLVTLACTEEAQGPGADDQPSPTSTAAASRCLPVSQAILDHIGGDTLTVAGGGTLRNGFAVKSDDYENVFMIAADIQGTGLEGEGDLGVWASNALEPGQGIVMAVDAVAQEFSDWPDADTTDANITSSSDGVSEARDCAEG